MRVVDLDRDMRDVIPTATTRDSDYLFEHMTTRTLDATGAGPGRRVLDVASGFGQDARALAGRGGLVVAAEPSGRMAALARLQDEEHDGPTPTQVRGWADGLPFADDSFDAVFCKGAIDHFDTPRRAIREMARVTRPDGRVVLTIANFDSLACRIARAGDWFAERWRGTALPRGRRHYDVPHDHFTRYELDLMREQAGEWLTLERVEGISLGWGYPRWSRWVTAWPEKLADLALRGADALARQWPRGADVVLLVGRPRSASTSA
ncbi:MAG: methyltransferase domain-containing protein [Myxococcota bacterium]